MSEQQTAGRNTGAPRGQKVFIIVLYLYVASLVWLVLSHHWYGVLPTWLDPH